MAGVKGRSGGARPNTGGKREGAGRKKKPGGTPRTRGSVWMDTRDRILDRDGRLCCCERCKSSGNPLPANEVDHVVPLWRGGADADDNLQSLNRKCHKAKSALEAQEKAAAEYVPPAAASDSLEFLRGVMNDLAQDPRLRVRAAISLAQYEHAKKGEGGKKDGKDSAAKTAGAGRFAPASGPRLAAVNGQKVSGGKGA